MLRVATLNTWKCEGDYRARLQRMADGLRALDADLLCLQEVFACAAPAADTAVWLAEALGMHAVATPARHGPRAFEGSPVPSSSGLAILARAALPEAERIPLPSDPRDGERIAQAVRLETALGPLRVANLHLTHLRDAAGLRRRQLEHLLAQAEDPAGAVPLLLAGDFNATPDASELALLRAHPAADWGPDDPDRFPGTVPLGVPGRTPRAVDHVVLLRGAPAFSIRSRQRVLDLADGGGYASDHAGVLVEIGV
ncbi:MAG: endonuclease/exonuclease/phosphatase family protein [Pseudomonadales bacterium]|nr:endonuclease/exonuclease/phosphatase family protein [Pseudomonadales bacterium]